jgi:hypothetical protein
VAQPVAGEMRGVSDSGSSGNAVARSIIDDHAELRVARLLNAAVQCWSPTRRVLHTRADFAKPYALMMPHVGWVLLPPAHY